MQARLAKGGFPAARVDVTSVGLDHLQMRNVHLQPGLDLGSVRLNRGVSLLWSNVDDISVDGAHVSVDEVAAAPPKLKGNGGPLPFRSLHVAGSTIALGERTGQLAGLVSADGGALDVTISISEPKGWSARGIGRVTWGKQLAVNGHVDLHLPKLDAGPYKLTDVQIPASIDATGIRIKNASAKLAGGVLELDGFMPVDGSPDVTVRATGLRIGELLSPTKRVTGTGLVDGEIALRADAGGLWIQRGELHARTAGTLQVTDADWRASVAAIKTSRIPVQKAVATALVDFKYDTLTAKVGSGKGAELQLALRGHGVRNKQELDIAVNVRGVRDSAAKLLKGVK